jgi:hypothetical protein
MGCCEVQDTVAARYVFRAASWSSAIACRWSTLRDMGETHEKGDPERHRRAGLKLTVGGIVIASCE